jgi:hypothetical protein
VSYVWCDLLSQPRHQTVSMDGCDIREISVRRSVPTFIVERSGRSFVHTVLFGWHSYFFSQNKSVTTNQAKQYIFSRNKSTSGHQPVSSTFSLVINQHQPQSPVKQIVRRCRHVREEAHHAERSSRMQ